MSNQQHKKSIRSQLSPIEQQREAVTSGEYLVEMNARLEKLRRLMDEQKQTSSFKRNRPVSPF